MPMSIRHTAICATAALSLSAGSGAAEAPEVAADIAPVHSLVARVMQGVAEPALVVRPGASPHGYALRPSEADALQSADAVFWVGEALTPGLGDTIRTLAPEATMVELIAAETTRRLPFREGAT